MRVWIGLAVWWAILGPVQAHDLYRSESKIVVTGREVKATLTFNLLDFPGVDQNGDKIVSVPEYAAAFDRVYATILQKYMLGSSGPPVRVTRDEDQLIDEHV